MKKKSTALAVLLAGIAPVWGAGEWPEAFTLICGEPTPDLPPPARDPQRPMASEVLKGQATRIASRFAGGLAYRVEATFVDEEVTNSSLPVSLTLTCDTRDPTGRLECSSNLRTLDSVPGFNSARATIPVPRPAWFDAINGGATVTVRWAKRDAAFTPPRLVFYQQVREIGACRYTAQALGPERAPQ